MTWSSKELHILVCPRGKLDIPGLSKDAMIGLVLFIHVQETEVRPGALEMTITTANEVFPYQEV
jgi:hypothetical protein